MNRVLVKKVVSILILAIMVSTMLVALCPTSNATGMPTISTIVGAGNVTGSGTKIEKVVKAVLYITRVIAVGIGLIMLAVLAMKYMTAAPGDKATIKKHAVVYVVGAIVLFGAAGILSIIESFATNNIKSA